MKNYLFDIFLSIKKKYFSNGDGRTLRARRNIAASFVIKIITVLSTYISYPLIVSYLNPTRYGIFLTLSSIIAWMLLLDIGFGSGLKNKLAEAKAYGEMVHARKLVSSTYVMLSLILLAIVLLFVLVNPFIPWARILNVPSGYDGELGYLVWIVFGSFCLSFLLRLIISIISADQKPATVSFIDMVAQLLSLAGLYLLVKTTAGSLIYASLIICFMPVLIYFLTSVYFFNTRYREIRPSFRFVDIRLTRSLMGLGFKFFVATISALVLFQTTNVLISYIVSPADVTLFNVAYKLFGIGYTVIMIVANPYWAAFSDAYALGDYDWMRRSFKRLKQVFYLSVVGGVGLLACADPIFKLWMGDSVKIPLSIAIAVFVYSNLMSWLTICIFPINGIGKVKLQFYSSILELILIGPIAIVLAHYFSTPGIILAPILVSLPRAIWAPVQLNKLIARRASGIWFK